MLGACPGLVGVLSLYLFFQLSTWSNSLKGDRFAEDFLRWLYRQHRLTPAELTDRLRSLDDLASGKLRPTIALIANPRCMGRPPLLPPSP